MFAIQDDIPDAHALHVALAPVHLIAPPKQPGGMGLDYINANTKLISIYGKIVMLAEKRNSRNGAPMLDGMDRFRADYETETSSTMKARDMCRELCSLCGNCMFSRGRQELALCKSCLKGWLLRFELGSAEPGDCWSRYDHSVRMSSYYVEQCLAIPCGSSVSVIELCTCEMSHSLSEL